MTTFVWRDNQFTTTPSGAVAVHVPTVAYGQTVSIDLPVQPKSDTQWLIIGDLSDVIAELERGCAELCLELPAAKDNIAAEIEELVRRAVPQQACVLRIIATNASGEFARSASADIFIRVVDSEAATSEGSLRCGIFRDRPVSSDAILASRLFACFHAFERLSRRWADRHGFDCALLVDPHGHIIGRPDGVILLFGNDADLALIVEQPARCLPIPQAILRAASLGDQWKLVARPVKVEDIPSFWSGVFIAPTLEARAICAIGETKFDEAGRALELWSQLSSTIVHSAATDPRFGLIVEPENEPQWK
ncbi:aminotransferase class IV [Bradyrhizobium sp. USDA 336]|uniref:aminotransferase class IV n=1 Tax=Bradyrhizobium sp. USDA 336 TaxID=3156311 RepID=UPI0038395ECD